MAHIMIDSHGSRREPYFIRCECWKIFCTPTKVEIPSQTLPNNTSHPKYLLKKNLCTIQISEFWKKKTKTLSTMLGYLSTWETLFLSFCKQEKTRTIIFEDSYIIILISNYFRLYFFYTFYSFALMCYVLTCNSFP